MPVANYQPGESFPIQFVWQLPHGDFIRAIFAADVLDLDFRLDRYLVRLSDLQAGRQEDATGTARERAELSREYWAMVGDLIGKRVYLAFEVDDGRPIRLRLDTLTQEHSFFTRLDEEE
jgi:hypothetical protein